VWNVFTRRAGRWVFRRVERTPRPQIAHALSVRALMAVRGQWVYRGPIRLERKRYRPVFVKMATQFPCVVLHRPARVCGESSPLSRTAFPGPPSLPLQRGLCKANVALTRISSLPSRHCSLFTYSVAKNSMPECAEKIDPEQGFGGSESLTMSGL
jgi:hypothetical protein